MAPGLTRESFLCIAQCCPAERKFISSKFNAGAGTEAPAGGHTLKVCESPTRCVGLEDPARLVLLPDRRLMLGAARLKTRYPVSHVHAFAVETAPEQNAVLVTGDPDLWRLSKQEPIEFLWAGKKPAH